jgi:hypothetical protein
MALSWEEAGSDKPVSTIDDMVSALARGSSFSARYKRMTQSRMDPNSGGSNFGYWVVDIGASCSESPAITMRPLGRRDRNASAANPRLSCPASSMTTQSASNSRRLLNS